MWLNPLVEWKRLNGWMDSFWSDQDSLSVNSYESDTAYLVQIPVAGVTSEDLDIDLKDNILKIKVAQKEKELDGYKVLHTETVRHEFVQKLRLPKNADANGVEAHVEDGLLLINIPKAPEAETKKIEVQ